MEERNLRKTRVGIVVSDKMDKTIVVAVEGQRAAPPVQEDPEAYRQVQGS